MKTPFKKFEGRAADLVTFTEEILNGKLHFLCSVSNHHIRVAVTGTRVNRIAEFSPEIPLDYIFYEDSGVANWLKKPLEKVDNSLDVKTEKVVKYKHLKIE